MPRVLQQDPLLVLLQVVHPLDPLLVDLLLVVHHLLVPLLVDLRPLLVVPLLLDHLRVELDHPHLLLDLHHLWEDLLREVDPHRLLEEDPHHHLEVEDRHPRPEVDLSLLLVEEER